MSSRRTGRTLLPDGTWAEVALALLGTVFALGGLVLVASGIGALVTADRPASEGWGLLVVGLLVLLVATVMIRSALLARRERLAVRPEALAPVTPAPLPPTARRPVTWAELSAALAAQFADTPFGVTANEDAIRIVWDTGRKDWWVLASRRRLQRTFVVTLLRKKPGVLARKDSFTTVDWHAGVPSLGAKVTGAAGRVWRYERHVELGTGRDGVRRAVDLTFSTRDVNRPLSRVLRDGGWRAGLDANARGALIVAAVGGLGAVGAIVAVVAQALLG